MLNKNAKTTTDQDQPGTILNLMHHINLKYAAYDYARREYENTLQVMSVLGDK